MTMSMSYLFENMMQTKTNWYNRKEKSQRKRNPKGRGKRNHNGGRKKAKNTIAISV
jgi:hypothetical protein